MRTCVRNIYHISSLRYFRSRPMTDSNTATRVIRFLDFQGDVHLGSIDSVDLSKIQHQTIPLVDGVNMLESSLRLTGKFAVVEKILCPIEPKQIIGIGLNYRAHAAEAKQEIPLYPVVFFKNVNSIQHPNDAIIIPKIASDPPEVDYECELAVILGKDCRNVEEKDALQYVLGYTAANDVSARRWQGPKGGMQWCRGKSFDTFCPLGPVLSTPEIIPDPQNLEISTVLNGKCMQKSNTKDMVFSVARLIAELSKDATIPKGTVILTGTPEGVGFTRKPPVFLTPGDQVEIAIENIGKLINSVKSQEP